MRIIAGTLGGRLFDSPRGRRTHPMSDKVRGALFNALGDIDGLRVFDPFAGSGALSLEALSRGAMEATALDIDKDAAKTTARNVKMLGLSARIKVVQVAANAWAETQPDQYFDLVLCDPPYDDVQPALLLKLARRTVTDGIVVFSLPPGEPVELPPAEFHQLATKSYGDATLAFYRRIQ